MPHACMHAYMLSPKALPATPLTLVTLSHSHPYPYYPKFLSIYQKHIITICTSSKPTPQPLSPQVFHLSAFSYSISTKRTPLLANGTYPKVTTDQLYHLEIG